MREEKRYALLAAVVLNGIWWLIAVIVDASVANYAGGLLGKVFFVQCVFHVAGYCYFQWKCQGKKLTFNMLFFPMMFALGIVFMILTVLFSGMMPGKDRMFEGIQYVFSLYVLWMCNGALILVCGLVYLGSYYVRFPEKRGKILAGAGMLAVVAVLLVALIRIGRMEDNFISDYAEDDGRSEEYEESQRFVERIKEREKKEEERKKQAQRKREEKAVNSSRTKYYYNAEECERILQLVKKNKGEEWTQQDATDWMALEWMSDGDEDYVVSMDCRGDSTMGGKVDLSGFHYLKRIDLSRTDVTEVILPDNLTELEEGGFQGCDNLSEITFGKGITNVDGETFDECGKLKKIVFQGNAPKVDDWISAWREAEIYYPRGTKGWNGREWKEYHMISYKK